METKRMKKSLSLSIIILSYNTAELTLQCIESIEKTDLDKQKFEVIVVDNASTDATISEIKKRFPWVHIIQNEKNIGFAAGNNVGIRNAQGKYVLLLNSDTKISHESFSIMLDFMEHHPKAGVSTCKLLLSDGVMDPACHRGFPTPWASMTYMVGLENLFPSSTLFGQYHQGYKGMNLPHQIDCPSGAFFLLRREVIDEVGLLDEDYFMYGEDIDWAYRIKEKGWEIWFNPATSIIHYKKKSGRTHKDREIKRAMDRHFYETMKLFYKKHYEKVYPWMLTRFVYLAIDIKITLMQLFS